jgi:(1->4)-alpha-D-glucan 1-alpha-D-glucosylmutase
VDYERRAAMMDEIAALPGDPGEAVASMLSTLEDGRAKLYVTWRLLQLRKQREALFRDGGYTAVRTTGQESKHVIAFARRQGGDVLVTVAPRLIAGLGVRPGNTPCDAKLWGEARIELPFVEEGATLRDAFTGRELRIEKGGLAVADVLAHFPVAVLVRLR